MCGVVTLFVVLVVECLRVPVMHICGPLCAERGVDGCEPFEHSLFQIGSFLLFLFQMPLEVLDLFRGLTTALVGHAPDVCFFVLYAWLSVHFFDGGEVLVDVHACRCRMGQGCFRYKWCSPWTLLLGCPCSRRTVVVGVNSSSRGILNSIARLCAHRTECLLEVDFVLCLTYLIFPSGLVIFIVTCVCPF